MNASFRKRVGLVLGVSTPWCDAGYVASRLRTDSALVAKAFVNEWYSDIDDIESDLQEDFNDHTEAWQEGEKGESAQEELDALEGAKIAVSAVIPLFDATPLDPEAIAKAVEVFVDALSEV